MNKQFFLKWKRGGGRGGIFVQGAPCLYELIRLKLNHGDLCRMPGSFCLRRLPNVGNYLPINEIIV